MYGMGIVLTCCQSPVVLPMEMTALPSDGPCYGIQDECVSMTFIFLFMSRRVVVLAWNTFPLFARIESKHSTERLCFFGHCVLSMHQGGFDKLPGSILNSVFWIL